VTYAVLEIAPRGSNKGSMASTKTTSSRHIEDMDDDDASLQIRWVWGVSALLFSRLRIDEKRSREANVPETNTVNNNSLVFKGFDLTFFDLVHVLVNDVKIGLVLPGKLLLMRLDVAGLKMTQLATKLVLVTSTQPYLLKFSVATGQRKTLQGARGSFPGLASPCSALELEVANEERVMAKKIDEEFFEDMIVDWPEQDRAAVVSFRCVLFDCEAGGKKVQPQNVCSVLTFIVALALSHVKKTRVFEQKDRRPCSALRLIKVCELYQKECEYLKMSKSKNDAFIARRIRITTTTKRVL